MKLNEILKESKMKTLQGIIDAAEKRAFDESSESNSAVSGNTVLKYAKQELKKEHQGDVPGFLAAMRAVEAHIKKEYSK